MNNSIDLKVYNMILNSDESKINEFIIAYTPFVIKTISKLKNQYVDIDNDEEFSIGLLALEESMKKYQLDKGSFLSFARIVIESRIKNLLKSKSKHQHADIDDFQIIDESINNENHELALEIEEFEKYLLIFGLNFELLIEASPKHTDTRKRAIKIGFKTSQDPTLVDYIYTKKRLPITLMSRAFDTSIKIIKKSKTFILSAVIIFDKKLTIIQEWLK